MAHRRPIFEINRDEDFTDTDHGDSDTAPEINGRDGTQPQRPVNASSPALLHTVKNQRSILALVVSNSNIYAGTQGGELLVSHSRVHKFPMLMGRLMHW